MPEEEPSPGISEEESTESLERMGEALEKEEGEESSEYLFEDEEPITSTSLDVRALEAMIIISDLLVQAIKENLDPREIAERIHKVQETLLRPRKRKTRKQQARRARAR